MIEDKFDVWFCGDRVASKVDLDIAIILVKALLTEYREQLKSNDPILNRNESVEISYYSDAVNMSEEK